MWEFFDSRLKDWKGEEKNCLYICCTSIRSLNNIFVLPNAFGVSFWKVFQRILEVPNVFYCPLYVILFLIEFEKIFGSFVFERIWRDLGDSCSCNLENFNKSSGLLASFYFPTASWKYCSRVHWASSYFNTFSSFHGPKSTNKQVSRFRPFVCLSVCLSICVCVYPDVS